jgi:ArsR family transcriptional regulator
MQDAEKLFRALADEQRLRILNLLLLDKQGTCVCELVDSLRLPQYQVSRQLGMLRDAGLVASEKRGAWVYYRIASGLPPLAGSVVDSLVAYVESSAAGDDRDRFVKRLQLREAGVCMVGYPQEAPYREYIPLVDRQDGTPESARHWTSP